MSARPAVEEAIAPTLAAHAEAAGFEIENERHGLVMLLADLIEWAEARNIDPADAWREAKELAEETGA